MFSKDELAHLVIDALEREGDTQDYYRLNHTTPEDRDRLAALMAEWLISVGVGVKIDGK